MAQSVQTCFAPAVGCLTVISHPVVSDILRKPYIVVTTITPPLIGCYGGKMAAHRERSASSEGNTQHQKT